MKKIILAISVIGIIALFGFNTVPKQYKVIRASYNDLKSLESAMNTYGRMGYTQYTQTTYNGYIIVIMSK